MQSDGIHLMLERVAHLSLVQRAEEQLLRLKSTRGLAASVPSAPWERAVAQGLEQSLEQRAAVAALGAKVALAAGSEEAVQEQRAHLDAAG